MNLGMGGNAARDRDGHRRHKLNFIMIVPLLPPDRAARPRRARDLTAGLHQIMKNAVDVGRNPPHLRTPPKSMVLRMDP